MEGWILSLVKKYQRTFYAILAAFRMLCYLGSFHATTWILCQNKKKYMPSERLAEIQNGRAGWRADRKMDSQKMDKRMDGRTDGQNEGRTDVRTDGKTDGPYTAIFPIKELNLSSLTILITYMCLFILSSIMTKCWRWRVNMDRMIPRCMRALISLIASLIKNQHSLGTLFFTYQTTWNGL